MLALAIDIGNSRVKTGIFKDGSLLSKSSSFANSVSEIQDILSRFPDIKAAVISSVAGEYKELSETVTAHCPLIHVSKDILLPVRIEYTGTAGHDRLAASSYVAVKNPDGISLVIDAGTCITYSLVDKNVFKGGAISPGIDLRYRALNEYTASLPFLKYVNDPVLICGSSTDESIQSGVLNGAVSEVSGMISKYRSEYPQVQVFLTGGYSSFFEKALKNGIFADPDLVLKGLYHILEFNAPIA